MSSRRWLVLLLAGAAILLLVGRWVAGLYVDYRWYAAMGAASLWRVRTVTTYLLRGASALAGTLFVFANLLAVRRSVVSLVLPRRVANLEIGEEVPGRYLTYAVIGLSVLLGALLTIPAESWTTFDLARRGVQFGETDPYFQADLGFFVGWIPFETSLYLWTLIAILLVTAVVVFLYALTPSLRWERGTLYASTHVRRHLTVLGALLLAALAWSYRLDAYGVLIDGSGPNGAFTYVDHRVMIPANLFLALITLGSVAAVLWAGWSGQLRVAFGAVTVVLLLSLVLRQLLPVLGQRMAPEKDPAVRERPYVATRAGYTRRAYGTDRVPADTGLAFASLPDAVRGVPIWDPVAILRAVNRTARGDAVVTGLGWQRSPAGLEAVVPERPATPSSPLRVPWELTRVLTGAVDDHGGIVRVDAAGAATDETSLLEPAIVFDSAQGYLVVPDSTRRYPAEEMETVGSRLAHAWGLQNFRLLFGDLPQPRPRIILRRDVRERVQALAPFLVQGTDVVPMLAGDTLYWVIDLYSASASYPLSAHVQVGDNEWSYFQHAATAIVRAATGRVYLVLDEAPDPLARAWRDEFPGLFTPRGSLPRGLLDALPPSADAARVQATVFARFGARGDSVRQGRTAPSDGADSAVTSTLPLLEALPGADGPGAMVIPVLDAADHVTGAVVAPGGATRHMRWLALDAPGERWSTILERLRAATDSAQPLSADAEPVHGAVRVIPVGRTLAFAQPLYAWRFQGPPLLGRVALLAGDTLRVGHSLAEAAGAPAGPLVPAGEQTPAMLRIQVRALYDTMRAAMRRGDWTAFGRAYSELGRLVGAAGASP